MNEFTKLAFELKISRDMVKTAGILRKLKNKLFNMFNPERREKTQELMERTNPLKELLPRTYKAIRNIEESINDLDLEGYERNVEDLKSLVGELGSTLNLVEDSATEAIEEKPQEDSSNLDISSDTAEEPAGETVAESSGSSGLIETEKSDRKERGSSAGHLPERKRFELPEDYVSTYYKDDNGALLDNLKEVGKKLGTDIKFGTNIIPTKEGLKPLYSLMAKILFVGMIKPGNVAGKKTVDRVAKEPIDPKEFLNKQISIDDELMEAMFYEQMPNFKILKVVGRELDGNENKKGGHVEVMVSPQSNGKWQRLPPPMDDYEIMIQFTLVDKGDPSAKGNYQIYRQTTNAVRNVSNKKPETTESEVLDEKTEPEKEEEKEDTVTENKEEEKETKSEEG